MSTWCHLRNGLRSFALDGIRRLELLDAPAKEVSLRALDEYLLDSYGIVRGGEPQREATLFRRARTLDCSGHPAKILSGTCATPSAPRANQRA